MSAYTSNRSATTLVEYINELLTPVQRPYGYENRPGISFNVKAGPQAVADFKDRLGTPYFFLSTLGSAGQVGRVMPLSTNRFTLPVGLHRRFLIRVTIPQLTTNCLFASGYSLIRSYALSIGGQTQVYNLSGTDMHHLMYQLETEPRASIVRQEILYTNVLSPYTFRPQFGTPDSGTRSRVVNWLQRGATVLNIPVPTPWYGPGVTGINQAPDFYIASDLNKTEFQVKIEVEDYSTSWREDPGDASSDRDDVPAMLFELLCEYIPKSEPQARLMKARELARRETAVVPSYYPYFATFTPSALAPGTASEINVPLGDFSGLNTVLTVRVLDTAVVDNLKNSITDFVPINRAEINIPGSENITQENPRLRTDDFFLQAVGKSAPLANENAAIFAFNPAMTNKALGGYIDFVEKKPTLKLTIPNEGTTSMNVVVHLLMLQIAFWGNTDLESGDSLLDGNLAQTFQLDEEAVMKTDYRRGDEFIH